jgi:hypothetical protein
MSILLSRMCVVPTLFGVVGLVALSSPPIALAGVPLLGAVVAASAVIITFALWRRANARGAMDIQRMWHRARHDRAALVGVDSDAQDAQDLMRLDSDKG